jgi:hypothetical protein
MSRMATLGRGKGVVNDLTVDRPNRDNASSVIPVLATRGFIITHGAEGRFT